jgi:DNA invertase Pin-like site-specific DNA recombinase
LRENGSISAFLCPQPIGLPDPLSPVQESAGPLAGILRGKNVGTPIEEVLQMLADSDTLIVTELSRLGRSTAEVIALVNELVARNIRVIILKQNLDISQHDMSSKIVITLFSLFAELERDLISLRTKEALAAKKQQGVLLGKPKGTIQKSKFDADLERIKDLLKLGLSVRKIASLLGYKNHLALNTYINKRKIRKEL